MLTDNLDDTLPAQGSDHYAIEDGVHLYERDPPLFGAFQLQSLSAEPSAR